MVVVEQQLGEKTSLYVYLHLGGKPWASCTPIQ